MPLSILLKFNNRKACHDIWDMLYNMNHKIRLYWNRVAEVARRRKVPLPKSLDLDENFKLKHTLFCCDIKNCRDLRTLGKHVLFLVKYSLYRAGSEVLHGIYCI